MDGKKEGGRKRGEEEEEREREEEAVVLIGTRRRAPGVVWEEKELGRTSRRRHTGRSAVLREERQVGWARRVEFFLSLLSFCVEKTETRGVEHSSSRTPLCSSLMCIPHPPSPPAPITTFCSSAVQCSSSARCCPNFHVGVFFFALVVWLVDDQTTQPRTHTHTHTQSPPSHVREKIDQMRPKSRLLSLHPLILLFLRLFFFLLVSFLSFAVALLM